MKIMFKNQMKRFGSLALLSAVLLISCTDLEIKGGIMPKLVFIAFLCHFVLIYKQNAKNAIFLGFSSSSFSLPSIKYLISGVEANENTSASNDNSRQSEY